VKPIFLHIDSGYVNLNNVNRIQKDPVNFRITFVFDKDHGIATTYKNEAEYRRALEVLNSFVDYR
jgi:hypothetical protein